ncbi:unnamed protein product, partial [Amoebophrya sp. A120]|eukprot:GSA120T00007584001.1
MTRPPQNETAKIPKLGNYEPSSAASASDSYRYAADDEKEKAALLETPKQPESILGSENIGDYASKKMMVLIVFTAVLSSFNMGLLISGAQTAIEFIHLAFETCGRDASGSRIVQCDDDNELL